MTPTVDRPRGRGVTVLAWLSAAILLFASWIFVDSAPTYEDKVAPFDVTVAPGEWGTGRDITARLVDATFADSLVGLLDTYDGNWLIVNIEAATITGTGHLSLATIAIDGVTYGADAPCCFSMETSELRAGLPLAGSLAFRLPTERRAGTAELRIGTNFESALDSLIVVPIDLGTLDRVESVAPDSPFWTAR